MASGTLDLSQYHLTFDDEFNNFSRKLPGSSGTGTWDTSWNANDPSNDVTDFSQQRRTGNLCRTRI